MDKGKQKKKETSTKGGGKTSKKKVSPKKTEKTSKKKKTTKKNENIQLKITTIMIIIKIIQKMVNQL